MLAWRICRKARAAGAFDGEGARLFPGRWNHAGTPIVYCSASLALAALETFVHVDPEDLPELVSIRVQVPDALVARLDAKKLPKNWRAYPAPAALQTLGSAWATAQSSLALLVPSAVLPSESNVLVNPRHVATRKLTIDAPEPFSFDPRMFK